SGTQGGRGGRGGRDGDGPRARARKVVLAWADTRNGIAQHESVSHALAVIEQLGYESGAYDTFIRTDSNIIAKQPMRTTGEPASGGPSLAMVDAIFFLGHRDVQLDDKQKAELLAFVHDEGKGFVAGHTALTAFRSDMNRARTTPSSAPIRISSRSNPCGRRANPRAAAPVSRWWTRSSFSVTVMSRSTTSRKRSCSPSSTMKARASSRAIRRLRRSDRI